MEELLFHAVRDREALRLDLRTLNLALDDNKRAQGTMERVNRTLERRVTALEHIMESWSDTLEEMRHLVRMGLDGKDLADLKKD
jgi:uridine kinase